MNQAKQFITKLEGCARAGAPTSISPEQAAALAPLLRAAFNVSNNLPTPPPPMMEELSKACNLADSRL